MEKARLSVLARVVPMLELMGQEVLTRTTEDYLSGPRPKKLGRVSGDLARSINYKIKGNRVVVGTNLPYGRIHEYGGRIEARNSPFLVFKVNGRWASKKSVRIPERPYLRPGLKDSTKPALTIVSREIDKALKEAGV